MSTATAPAPPRLAEQLSRPALSAGETTIDIADLVLLGVLSGDWPRLERQARVGLALSLEPQLEALADERHAAATAFRYAHGLISANDFRTWLGARSLTVRDLSGYLDRELRRRRAGADVLTRADRAGAPDGDTLAEILWAEAIGARLLEALAARAADLLIAADLHGDGAGGAPPEPADELLSLARAADAAGLDRLGVSELRERIRRLMGFEQAMARMRVDVAEPAALRRCLASHSLDWLAVSGSELELTTEGAAREARLLLTEDGVDTATVVELGGVRAPSAPRPRQVLIGEAPESLAGAFAAAAPGEVVGPWPDGGGWRLLVVEGKQPPSLDIPALRERAIEERLRDALHRHGAGRIRRLAAL